MSRSYKKFPLFRDNLWGKSMKKGKQYANRKLRRNLKQQQLDVPNGSYYKRMFMDSYDLYEYKSYETKQDVIQEWHQDKAEIENGINSWKNKYTNTLEEKLIDWYKSYKMK